MKQFKRIQILIASVSILMSSTAMAAPAAPQAVEIDSYPIVIPNAPDYYPKEFQRTGVMRGQQSGRTMVISGLQYYYGVNTKAHSVNSQFVSINGITPDTPLGFSFVVDEQGRHLLTEVWIIPGNATIDPNLDQ